MMMDQQVAARDAAIAAVLPWVAEHGWTDRALRLALPGQAALFDGPADMVDAYLDLADRRMAAGGIDQPRLSQRVRGLIARRFAQAVAEREASRRAVALLCLPGNAALAARTLARTVDAIWHAAGDRSADFSWYTKRGSLAAVYGATLLFWLAQDGLSDPEDTATLAFLDRRLAGLARFGKLTHRLGGLAARVMPTPSADVPPLTDVTVTY